MTIQTWRRQIYRYLKNHGDKLSIILHIEGITTFSSSYHISIFLLNLLLEHINCERSNIQIICNFFILTASIRGREFYCCIFVAAWVLLLHLWECIHIVDIFRWIKTDGVISNKGFHSCSLFVMHLHTPCRTSKSTPKHLSHEEQKSNI